MSLNIEYQFTFEDKMIPQIIKNIYLDGDLVDSTTIDIPNEYKNLPIEILKDFSQFLIEKFNYLCLMAVDYELNQYKFSELIEPMKFICRTKTGCDEAIDSIENPKQNINPFPNLEEL